MVDKMHGSVTPDDFVEQAVADGLYPDRAAAVAAGLRLLRDRHVAAAVEWPRGGGTCGALIRSRDWSATPLGPTSGWSLELRATVANIVNSPVAKVLMWGPDHILLYNDAYIAIAGAKHPAALGGTAEGIWPEVWAWNRERLATGMRGELQHFIDQPITLVRGGVSQTLVMDLYYTPVYEADGSVGGVMCTCVDNSARVEAEARLAANEGELRRITDSVPMLIAYLDSEQVYRFVNGAYEHWFGYARHEILGQPVRALLGERLYAERRGAIERALAGETVREETVLASPEGERRRFEVRYLPHVEDGRVLGVQVLAVDVEERVRRETALAVSNARFRTAMDAIHGVLWTNSADGRMVGEQPGWAAMTGQSHDEYQGYGWAGAVHPDDRAASVETWQQAVAAKKMFVHEHRVRQHGGAWRTFAIRALPILDPAGEIVEWVGVHTDITHRRAAEQALRQQAEDLARQVRHRQRAEEQLRQLNETLEARVIAEIEERRQAEAKLAQAQKMETVGKLTGGVAHDFNNLLQVVSGNLQLLARDVAGNDRAETRVANAMAGVARGAKLAAQLLAFGRRAALEPKVVNVTRFVRGMDDILRRAIGEGIEVETIFGGGLWNTFIDPVQVENALLNLAINARDAMDGHGKLTIELANAHLDDHYALTHEEVAPGQYVMLAVSDTGCGMTPEVMAKVFEPFFSTKKEGKGSGLGLSMVYGFVKQSGGHIKIYSEVGEGTTIRLYLPRAMGSEDVEVEIDTGPIAGGTETVLVVEDDEAVRATVVELLSELGYRVLKAGDAASALAVVESGVPIDLLFTDVVMPGTLKSPELARKARERLPGLAVLFTSGYTENSIVHGGRLDAGVELLSKPYTREALARRIRHVLANQGQRRVAAMTDGAPSAGAAGVGQLRATVLLVEDDALIRASSADMLRTAGCDVIEAATAEGALSVLRDHAVDVLVSDVNLPGASGPELAARARQFRPGVGVVFATGDAGAVILDAVGDSIALAKPYDAARLTEAVRLALARREQVTTVLPAQRDEGAPG